MSTQSIFAAVKRAARFTGFDTWRHYMIWLRALRRGDDAAREAAGQKWNRFYTEDNR